MFCIVAFGVVGDGRYSECCCCIGWRFYLVVVPWQYSLYVFLGGWVGFRDNDI